MLIIALVFLNIASAHNVDNITIDDADNQNDDIVISTDRLSSNIAYNSTNELLSGDEKQDTAIIIPSDINSYSLGEYFTAKLVDSNNNPISDVNLRITISNNVSQFTTDKNGNAYMEITQKDGTYNVVSEFLGNDQYNPSSKTTTITVKNTIEVAEGLSNQEIQNIIDNAKDNNVLVFKGSSYNDINLFIDKSLTLISYSNTVLKSSSSSPVITIRGQKSSLTTINGFKIQSTKGDGIKIEDNQYVDILNNVITANGNGIVALDTNYLNIEKNTIENNGKTGITLALTKNTYILNNQINKNDYGIGISKSENTYIYKNTITNNNKDGILTIDEINNVYYGEGPKNLHIDSNTITKNGNDAINLRNCEDGLEISKNTLSQNGQNGIEMAKVKSNKITSNSMLSNNHAGIRFDENYIAPKNQVIDSNVMLYNSFREMDAKDTMYDQGYFRLVIEGTNWFGDNPNICPKIKASNYNLVVDQISSYYFSIRFEDANGNVASGLPSMVGGTKTNNGRTTYFSINEGSAIFERDASDGDRIITTVDGATRTNIYKFEDSTYLDMPVEPYDPYLRPMEDVGKPYPDRPKPGRITDLPSGGGSGEDSGSGSGSSGSGSGESGSGSGEGSAESGDGNGNGQGNVNAGEAGNSTSNGEYNGNSTLSQNMNPGSSANNPISSSSSSTNPSQANSPSASSSSSASSESSPASQSVMKQILIEEDELIRISGMTLLILLILLTIIYYYRDDIKEMQSKM